MKLMSIILVVSGMIAAGVAGMALKSDPQTSPMKLWSIVLGIIALDTGMLGILALCKMTTEMREDGLFIRLLPFMRSSKSIPLEGVVKCEVMAFSPLSNLGGSWGKHSRLHDTVYRLSGFHGVRLVYNDGKRIVLGSERPEQLNRAITGLIQHTK
ncbi:MAG: DUF6141 family protein [bacterium]|nr:DUF6141 family protein [Candidatus Sumerlaeota bacterium]